MSTFEEIGSGGVVASNTASLFVTITITTTGGTTSSGIVNSFSTITTSGGVVGSGTITPSTFITTTGGSLNSGSANLFIAYDIRQASGIVCSGLSLSPSVVYQSTEGGSLVSGQSEGGKYFEELSQGGAAIGGSLSFELSHNHNVSGGSVLSGVSLLPDPVYHYPNTDDVFTAITMYGSSNVTNNYNYIPAGEVVLTSDTVVSTTYRFISSGTSSDSPPSYSGVTVGYQNSQNPTIVDVNFDSDLIFSWNLNSYITKDYDFAWNTGRIRQYWYRVVSRGGPDSCPPIKINDCCMQYTMNVHARSVDDLCKKLIARNWTWPILTVQRFSRPAESIDIQEDALNGISHDCNIAETVEVCDNPSCGVFCIDFELFETWGVSAKCVRKAFKEAESDGGILLRGQANVIFTPIGNDFFSTSEGEITISGEAITGGDSYHYIATSGIILSGGYVATSTHWEFDGGEWPLESLFVGAEEFTEIGSSSEQTWDFKSLLGSSDDQYSVSDISFGKTSKLLMFKNFGFDIPEGSEIIGIRVDIERKATSQIRDKDVYLILDDQQISDNMAKTAHWPIGFETTASYGSYSDTWRDSGLFVDLDTETLNDPNFGFALRVESVINAFGVRAYVDFAKMMVLYQEPEHQFVKMGGSADVLTSHYKYSGSGFVQAGLNSRIGLKVNRRFSVDAIGRGSIGPSFASIVVGGQYSQHFYQEATGGVLLNGDAVRKLSSWTTESDGAIIIEGFPRVRSSAYKWESSGGLTLSSSNVTRVKYYVSGSGSIIIGGEVDTGVQLSGKTTGGVTTTGEAVIRSSAQSWIGSGEIELTGIADVEFSHKGTFLAFGGAYVRVSDILMVFGTTSGLTALESPQSTVAACGCTELPLSLQYTHNLFSNNKLAQFLSKNNISVPRINVLNYNRTNGSWQSNFRWTGFSTTTTQKETWNVVFELMCTNLLGGQAIGENIWKLTISVVQKNNVTQEDFDTKVVIGFKPDKVCTVADFKFKVALDTKMGFTTINPNSSIYQSLLYDNVGLFKTAYWLSNPIADFSISQSGITNPTIRYKSNIG